MRPRERRYQAESGMASRQRGQSLIIAVITLFVLLFVGGLFVGLVANNLLNTGRSRDTVKALEYAEAGIRYADHHLMTSADGADWRPALEPPADQRDPDKRWLDEGYSRIEFGNEGRALVRVSMNPNPRDPLGKYLRIDAVGRVGHVDPADPTSFLNSPAPRLRRELLAYKSVGITDHLRFVTNKTNETKFEAVLGGPEIGVPVYHQFGGLPVRTFGSPVAPGYVPPSASIRVNGDLRLLNNLTLVVDPRNHESVLVAGKIEVDDATNPQTRPKLRPADDAGAPAFGYDILPSDDPAYSTFAGLLRDDSGNPDTKGYARSISRLEPPLIDTIVQATNTTRYKTLTRDAGMWITRPDNTQFNSGRIALGAGVYLDNFGSVERETLSAGGGQSFRSIWLRPGSTADWNGPYYNPPGAFVEFGNPVVQDRDASGNLIANQYSRHPGFVITRDSSERVPFVHPSGNLEGRIRVYSLFIWKPINGRPVLKLETESFRSFLRDVQGMSEIEIDRMLPEFNGVVYAEGNLRVRGLLPGLGLMPIRRDPLDTENLTDSEIRSRVNTPAVTLVSGNNIYIEGSLVREAASSMIGLLATNYVVVNTTQFVAPNKGLPYSPGNGDPLPPHNAVVDVAEGSSTPPYTLSTIFGDDAGAYTDLQGNGVPLRLMVRHGIVGTGDTYLNLAINEAFPPQAGNSLYQFNQALLPSHVYKLGMSQGLIAGGGADAYEQRSFVVFPPSGNYVFFPGAGVVNSFRPSVDTTFIQGAGTADYGLSRAAVVPMDVRIEATIYAQNGSFFIIPGYPLNNDPSDTREQARRKAATLGLPLGMMLRPDEEPPGIGPGDDRHAYFPFYNEPFGCRITIVGAISENRTASAADQAAWMRLWGYLPEALGSTGYSPNATVMARIPKEHLWVGEVGPDPANNPVDNRHPMEQNAYDPNGNPPVGLSRGIRYLYDPALSAPYPGYAPGQGTLYNATGWAHYDGGSFRQDNFGRTLPALPRLPVSTGYVFYGEIR